MGVILHNFLTIRVTEKNVIVTFDEKHYNKCESDSLETIADFIIAF